MLALLSAVLIFVLMFVMPTAIIAGCLWGAARMFSRVSFFYARALLGVVCCLAPLAVGAYFAREDLGAHSPMGSAGLHLFFVGPAVLASVWFLARPSTRRASLFGAISIVLAKVAFALSGPLWMEFAPPPERFRRLEANVIGDIRSILSSQVAYASSNDGAYGRLRCLEAPVKCGFAPGTSSFLDAQNASLLTRNGYRRSFVPGDAKAGAPDANGFNTFAYVAVPLVPGTTGARGFCGDDTGRICVTSDGSEPLVTGGRCPLACSVLE